MKKKLLSGLILGMLSFGVAAPAYADVWKKQVVQHSVKEYDIHLTMQDKLDHPDEEYEKELLVFISDKAVKEGYQYFTFTVDATNKDVLVVHVQNLSEVPDQNKGSNNLAIKYFVAKDVLELN